MAAQPPAGFLDEGRIPFRIRVGVTGHRDLDDSPAFRALIREQLDRLTGSDDVVRASPATPLRLSVVSELAEGADRIVVDEVFLQARERGVDAQLEVILPLPRDDYARAAAWSSASRTAFAGYLERAAWISEPSARVAGESDEDAYEDAGRRLVARCDVLVALWQGGASGGRGGTAETLLEAAWRGKPCIWLATDGSGAVTDNLAPGAADGFHAEVAARAAVASGPASPPAAPPAVVEPLRQAYAGLDELNREHVSERRHARLVEELSPRAERQEWVDAPFQRVNLLAGVYQRRFRTCAALVSLLATVAGALLGLTVAYDAGEELTWAELASLVAAAGVFSLARRRRFHARWLSYRALAERLRSARYLAPTGIDYRRTAGLEGIYVEGKSDDWVTRAFEEVWGKRGVAAGREAPEGAPPPALRDAIVDQWIGGQIAFHRGAASRHERAERVLTAGTTGAFALTIVAVAVHALGLWHEPALFASIALPAAGASLGALATVGQHRALARRYGQMHVDLAVIRRAAVEAVSVADLRAASSEAARVIAQEGGDWLGAMWFLDVEHV